MILTIVFTYPTQNKILYGDLYNIKQSYYNKDISFEIDPLEYDKNNFEYKKQKSIFKYKENEIIIDKIVTQDEYIDIFLKIKTKWSLFEGTGLSIEHINKDNGIESSIATINYKILGYKNDYIDSELGLQPPNIILLRIDDKEEFYKESIFVGYRWADKQKDVEPLFPFGYGLSYTTFDYAKPVVDKRTVSSTDSITVSVKVKNSGSVAAKEIVQLYISDKKSSLPRPIKELKGFKKILLNPGEEKMVSFTIGKDALSFFDDKKHEWVAEPGKFEAIIASSSRDIRGKVGFELR